MVILRWISLILVGIGVIPLWEQVIKFAFNVEYNFVAELAKTSNSTLITFGLILIVLGVVLNLFVVTRPINE